MKLKIELGRWGESFYVTDDGSCGVQDCNGDRVELEPDQWRRVAVLLADHLPSHADSTRRATVPGRMTFTVLEKAKD